VQKAPLEAGPQVQPDPQLEVHLRILRTGVEEEEEQVLWTRQISVPNVKIFLHHELIQIQMAQEQQQRDLRLDVALNKYVLHIKTCLTIQICLVTI
jgi:hypothetical protein